LKYLIPNADDFGYTRDVNEGIIHAHRQGILTATTLMATGAAFDHAVALARENPVARCRRAPGSGGQRRFPPTVTQLIQQIARRRICIYDELAAQVRKVQSAGIQPTHLDTHKHTHLLPPVLNAVARIAVRVSDSVGAPSVRSAICTAAACPGNGKCREQNSGVRAARFSSRP
jgi:predicted glycoside hydrolase/deacetylase ChbG (UPF0249 family)